MILMNESINDFDIAIWEMMKSISYIKQKVNMSPKDENKELRILQNELMEASEWMKNLNTIE